MSDKEKKVKDLLNLKPRKGNLTSKDLDAMAKEISELGAHLYSDGFLEELKNKKP